MPLSMPAHILEALDTAQAAKSRKFYDRRILFTNSKHYSANNNTEEEIVLKRNERFIEKVTKVLATTTKAK